LKIGILFSQNSTWSGGTYYLLSLLQAILSLKSGLPYELYVYYTQEKDRELLQPFEKRGVRLVPLFVPKAFRVINRILSREAIKPYHLPKVDLLYPASFDFPYHLTDRLLFWIPDMQEKFYPQFFPEAEVLRRDEWYRRLVQEKARVVFSSETGRQHFLQFYPDAEAEKLYVFPFATSVAKEQFTLQPLDLLQQKYGFQAPFIICPNVLARSKNHPVVIEAALELRKQSLYPTIVFTGNEYDGNKRDYPDGLKAKVKSEGLEHIHFLGLIPREDQLSLMVHSKAILQPSLFEGWSTSVEEAKALDKWLICSDIAVLKEQVTSGVHFFEAQNAKDLARVIGLVWEHEMTAAHGDYNKVREEAGERFLNVAHQVIHQQG
jgi:glycosyltransferase involved in cell wall biosynthesis